jgi:cell division protein FtsB
VSEGSDGMKSVNYAGIVAPLIEAVKEQQKQIEVLRGENRDLRVRVEKLESSR